MANKKDIEDIVKSYDELKKSEKDLTESQQKRLLQLKEMFKEQKKISDYYKEYLDLAEKDLKTSKEKLKILKEQDNITDEQIKNVELEIKRNQLLVDLRKTNYEKEFVSYKNIKDTVEKIVDLQKENFRWANNVADSLTKKLGLSQGAFRNSFFGQMIEQKNKGISMSDQLKEIGTSIASSFSPLNIFGALTIGITKNTKELAIEENNLLASFNATTGAAGKYDNAILEISRSNRALAVQAKDVAQAFQGLIVNFSGFTELEKSVQDDVVLFTTNLQRLGISSDTTGKIFNTLTKNLGFSTTQIKKAHMEIMGTAKQLGLSQKQMSQDFAETMPKLVVFGDQAINKFKELEKISKSTGIAVGGLLDLAEKFDTFEQSAEIVGKLNATLGGPFLDSIRLVQETDPTKRIIMLNNALRQGGVEFKNLGYYMQKSISQTLGKSVEETGKILSGDINKYLNKTKEAELSQKDFNEMLEKTQPLLEKIKMWGLSLAVGLEPLFKLIGWIVDGLNMLSDAIRKVTAGQIGLGHILTGVLGIWVLFKIGVGGVVSKMVGLGKSVSNVVTKLPNLTKNINIVGNTAQGSSSGMLSFAGSILMISAGIALVVLSISSLAGVIKNMTGGEFAILAGTLGIIAGGFFLLSLGILAAGAAGAAAALPMLAFGGSILLLGIGVSLVIFSLTNLFKELNKSAVSVPQLALGLATLSWSLMNLSIAAGFTALTLPSVLFSLILMSFVLNRIGSTGMMATFALSSMFNTIGQMSSGVVSNLSKVASGIKEIVSSIDKLPLEKSFALSTTMQTIALGSNVPTANIEKVSTITKNVVNATNEVNTTSTSNQGSSGTGSTLKERVLAPIVLKLNERILSKFVIDVMSGELNPRKV